jgi:hypothetical protein
MSGLNTLFRRSRLTDLLSGLTQEETPAPVLRPAPAENAAPQLTPASPFRRLATPQTGVAETMGAAEPAQPSGFGGDLTGKLRRAIRPPDDGSAQPSPAMSRVSGGLLRAIAPQQSGGWDECLPDGTPAIEAGIPEAQRSWGRLVRPSALPGMEESGPPVGRAVIPPTSPYSRLSRPQEGGTPPFVAPGTQVLQEEAPVMPSRLRRPADLPRASVTVNDAADFSNEPSLQTRLRRALDVSPNGPQAATPQQEPSADVGTVPVDERRRLILDGGSPAVGARLGAQPSAGRPAFDRSTYDRRRAQIESQLSELLELENTKAVDKNGRLKSTFLGILQGFLGGGLGGAIYGGIRGGVHPEWDEELKQVAEVAKKRGRLDQVMKTMGQLADLDKTYASLSGGGMTQAQLATQRRGFANYIAKFYPQGYTRGARPDVDAELDRLQMEPPPALPRKGGQGRGYVFSAGQMIALPDGSGGFTYQVPHDSEGNDAPAMSESQQRMSDAEYRRIEIARAELNLRRAKENLAPVTFDDYVTGGGDTPAAAAPAGSSAPPIQTLPVPRANGPQLVPSGQKREPVPVRGVGRGGLRRPGGHGGSSGGSSRGDAIGESLKARDAARYRVEATQADARAARARANGDDATAAAESEAARQARAESERLSPSRRATTARDASQVLPGVPTSSYRVSRSKFRANNPRYKNRSDAEVDAAIRGDGYEPVP